MNITGLTLLLISCGGIVMFVSILKYRTTIREASGLLSEDNKTSYRLYRIHQILMFFFLTGYLVVFFSILFDIHIIGNFFTGTIFFFGAVFVFVGILLQSDMLMSIRRRHEKLIRKNQQLLQTENVTIFALAYQAELRDLETGQHLERTSRYVRLLTEQLSRTDKYRLYLTPGYITDICKAAPLHDIGKVGIPDAILKKPDKLTVEEFEIIKRHCEYGADILRTAEKKLDFQSFFRVAIKLVFSHHERWDGKGYPQGLKNEKIPLSARLMALADVYDALRSERCYKKAMSHEEACDIISKEKGRQFDPEITDAFINAEKKFQLISEAMADPAME